MGSILVLTLQQALFILSRVMTQFMSNIASCALLALSVSPLLGMGVDPCVLMAMPSHPAFGTPVVHLLILYLSVNTNY
ncbi:MAG: hypothetical protein ACLSXY_04085 [Veillonella sp.]